MGNRMLLKGLREFWETCSCRYAAATSFLRASGNDKIA